MYIGVYREHNIYVSMHLTFMDNIYQGGVWVCMSRLPRTPTARRLPFALWKGFSLNDIRCCKAMINDCTCVS